MTSAVLVTDASGTVCAAGGRSAQIWPFPSEREIAGPNLGTYRACVPCTEETGLVLRVCKVRLPLLF